MPKKKELHCEQRTCAPFGEKIGTCQIESMVSIDERGQMVLPKAIRTKMNIQSGDKLTLVSWKRKGKITSISLIKSDELNDLISEFYSSHQE